MKRFPSTDPIYTTTILLHGNHIYNYEQRIKLQKGHTFSEISDANQNIFQE